eukprot:Selendium_serpulae@DN6451_c1_g2_i10.p1
MADRIDAQMGDMPDIGSHCHPLHLAALAGHTAVVECLINSGADVGALTSKNNTALHCAALGGHSDTVKYLVDRAHADINAVNIDGDTPIQLAIRGYLGIVANSSDVPPRNGG